MQVRKLAANRDIQCQDCDGKGGKKVTKCGDCNGMGVRTRTQRMGPMISQSQAPCSKCSATGEIVDPKTTCKICNGKKTCRNKKILEVQLYFSAVSFGNSVRVHTAYQRSAIPVWRRSIPIPIPPGGQGQYPIPIPILQTA